MQIVTDGKEKLFKYRHEVPAKVLEDRFSHLDEDEFDNFILYRKRWYHISDFMQTTNAGTDMVYWDGYISETFFSGIVIKLPKFKDEVYVIGRYWT